ncbi:hypothetical protein PISL3812_00495 [Talaromyces islandicus]|uniref:Uncharacterized protein n=1 Tax=Talaromyces islandicus TaxID=28573 RepID=A0A0U1LJF5_TALIS|nr:hypothetical protein PISL3812_00495 [Talaromyces islandicus]
MAIPADEKLDTDSISESSPSSLPEKPDTHSISESSTPVSLLGKIKHRLSNKCAEWAPLMRAKSNLDSEYNFPAGRYAGQGIGPSGKN